MNQSPVQPTARPADREPKPVESDAPVHGPRPGMVFGIKARLFLAFAGMAALTVLAGLVAWYVFGEVGQSVTRITAGSVPAISLSRRLAEKSAELSAAAPALMASTDQQQREQAHRGVEQRTEEILLLIKALQAAQIAPESVAELSDIHRNIAASSKELNQSVEARLRLKALREKAVANLNAARGKFQDVLEPLVDDAVFNMVISSEDMTARSTATISELVNGGVATMNRLLQISAEVNLAAGLLSDAASVSDATFMQPIRERFVASAAGIRRTLGNLPESPGKLKLDRAVGALLAYGTGDASIFATRERQLQAARSSQAGGRVDMIAAVKRAHEGVLETLTPIVDNATFELVIASEKATGKSQNAITQLIDVGVTKLQRVLTLRADGILAAGLLTESAGVSDAALLQPLRERFTAAASGISHGLKGLEDVAGGTQELRDAASELLKFGTGADSIFSLRDEELRQIAASQSSLETSHRLAARLGDEVASLVAAAESSGTQAADHANRTIQRGNWQLILIIGISVAGATLIMLLYVTRRVVRPLEDMTSAMTTLAAGDISVDIPAQERADEVGRMAKALRVFRDTAVEVQRSNLREIAEARRRLTDAIESIAEGFSLYDADDRLLVCNTRYREMLYPGMQGLIKPGTPFQTIMEQAADHGLIRNVKGSEDPWVSQRLAQHRNPSGFHVQQRSDGTWVRVDERKTEDGGVVAVYSDITDDRRREEQLQAAKDEAERALGELRQTQASLVHAEKMASLGQLTAGIAHEIKNPLNFVNNFAEVSAELLAELKEGMAAPLAALGDDARDDALDLFETLTGNLAKIKEHGKRADDIVKGMLSHAHAGPSTAQLTDLNGLIEETLNLAYHGMRAADQGFNVTLERDLDPAVGEVEVFPQEITRVLLNLIGNGFYAVNQRRTQSAEPTYQPTLKISTRNIGNQVEVRVRDNGTGIPASVKNKIFNPFFTTKPTGEGTGLGLSLSHETIVRQHQGRLQVESQEGEFTEFIITLPRTLKRARAE